MTVARYSGPCPVRIIVTSPHHTWSGPDAVNDRRTRSAGAGLVPCRVRLRRGGRSRPTQPCSAMIAATVFTLTVQPASHRSSTTRGDP